MRYTVVIACVYYAFFNKVGWVCIKKSVATPQKYGFMSFLEIM
jgi:hypothetical protein